MHPWATKTIKTEKDLSPRVFLGYKKDMTPPRDDNQCFVCGQDNPIGLKLSFRYEDGEARCDLNIPAHFQGWKDITHGGIVATLLDEIMAKAAHHAGHTAVTMEITVSYKKPTPAETPLRLTGRLLEQRRRVLLTQGEICDQSGTLLASAQAKFYIT
jgi:uncharacterized protein (TIGR00369 family)